MRIQHTHRNQYLDSKKLIAPALFRAGETPGFQGSVSETYAEPGRARIAISNSLRVLPNSATASDQHSCYRKKRQSRPEDSPA